MVNKGLIFYTSSLLVVEKEQGDEHFDVVTVMVF